MKGCCKPQGLSVLPSWEGVMSVEPQRKDIYTQEGVGLAQDMAKER